jgi:hypothetical protein
VSNNGSSVITCKTTKPYQKISCLFFNFEQIILENEKMISDFLAVPERADSYEQNSMIAHPQAQYGDRYLAPRIHAVLFVPRVYTIGTELNKRMPHIVQLRVFRGLVSHAET